MNQEYSQAQYEMIKQGMELFLKGLQLDITDQHLIKTPHRVAKAWLQDFAWGYKVTEKQLQEMLSVEFDCDEMIVVKDIPFFSHCIHHLVMFQGTCKIGYVANKRVVGLSKLPRVLDVFAARLQIQERLTREVAETIQKYLRPVGVGVVIEASHNCVCCRGAKKPGSQMITSCLLGKMRTDKAMRSEFLNF
jgi:GTP cyclohydrolase I